MTVRGSPSRFFFTNVEIFLLNLRKLREVLPKGWGEGNRYERALRLSADVEWLEWVRRSTRMRWALKCDNQEGGQFFCDRAL